MFRLAFLILVSSISLSSTHAFGAENGPADGLVQNEISAKKYYNVVLGGVIASKDYAPSSKSKLGSADLLEWSTGDNAFAATYGNAGLENEKDVTRLTELDVTKGEVTAVTTTFFNRGLRSRTECSGKTSSTLQCATASRNLCESFKVNMKKYGAQLGLATGSGNTVSEGTKAKMVQLGEQCSQYASFLDNTLDPNKLLTGSMRGNRDSEIVEKDLEAINAVKKAAQSKPLRDASLKGINDVFGKGNDVGASSTGMRERSERLKNIGADFKVLSKLAFTCSDANFVEARDGANEQISKKPHDGRTRP